MTRTVIVGGGITGLSAAYELANAGAEALLFEPQPSLGGVIQTDRVEGCVLEAGPDSFLSAKPAGMELVKELGLGDDLISSNDHERVTYLVKNGRLVPMPDGLMMMVPTKIWPVAVSSLLGWGTKIRMGLEYFHGPPDPPNPDRTVAEFIAEHYGQETVDYLAEPLLSGVYGGTASALSVNSVLPRFVEMERNYGSLTRGVLAAKAAAPPGRKTPPLFQTLKGGLRQLTEALESKIRGKVDVAQAAVESVEREAWGYRVFANGEWIEARNIVFACPAWQAAPLTRQVNARLAGLLGGIDYSSSLTLAIGVRRADCGPIPKGFGFLVPRPERKRLVACTFVGAKFSHRVPDDWVVLRCFLGGAGNEAILDWDDADLIGAVRTELKSLLGWDPQPGFTRISRWRKSMAQYTVGHEQRVSEIRELAAGEPGLYLAGNAYDGIGIPDCIRTGRAAGRSASARQAEA